MDYGWFAPGETAREGCGEGRVETPCTDRASFDAGAAADTTCRVGVQFVAFCDGAVRTEPDAAAATGAACGIGHGQQRDGISALAAAVFQDETDKAQHGKQRGPGCPQALEGDGRDPASREFPSYGTAERLGTGRIVGIRPTCGDGVGGCAI